eukprot:CAMPEP_0198730256 /NCGR_PEP_ID=MMETSP1475-20131203/23631_1 /TAXON_ID= ORGANISM="Unidentified sp., Strain CCMP1999" /NCGR_SAMPLE_ID=MMETSP1475 /ASSEMBLY_ACC=CAM_ASM_001111 /LENGTH=561 /DNA_ID=CAMNT_0044493043 /DNA_START=141 /DNA_END=1826 /DNA_ORIENTATION=-
MASVTVDCSGIGYPGKKLRVPITPSTPLSKVRDEACAKLKLKAQSYGLSKDRHNLDLSLPFRLANLAINCRIDLVSATSSKKPSRVNVALDVEVPPGSGSSQRIIRSYLSDVTLWEVLAGAEDGFGPGALTAASNGDDMYLQPVLTSMNRKLDGELHRMTLASVGLVSGSVLIRVRFEKTDTPIAQMLPALQEMAKEAEDRKNQEPVNGEKQTSAAGGDAGSSRSTRMEARSSQQPQQPQQPCTVQNFQAQPSVAPPQTSTVASEAAPRVNARATGPVESPKTPATAQSTAVPQAARAQAVKVAAKQTTDANRRSANDELPVNIDLRVFRPSADQVDISRIQIPDDFYNFSENDLRAQLAQQAKNRRETEGAVLMTRRMRERAKEQRLQKFNRCIIRIRLPDRSCVQGTFRSKDDVGRVFEFLRKQLRDENLSFYLYTTPPVRRFKPSGESLWELGLVPAGLVYMAFDDKSLMDTSASALLKDNVFALMEDLPREEPVVVSFTASDPTTATAADSTDSNANNVESYDDWNRPQPPAAAGPQPPPPTVTKSGQKMPKWFRPQ